MPSRADLLKPAAKPTPKVVKDPAPGETPPAIPASKAAVVTGRETFTFRYDKSTLQDLDTVHGLLRQRTEKKIKKSWLVEAALKAALRDPEKLLETFYAEMPDQAKAS